MKKQFVIASISFVLSFSVFTTKAAQDTTDININTTVAEYLNFTGTAVGATKYYTADEIKPVGTNRRGPRVTLGTLGLESNSVGDCDIEFSTKNNFRLRHTVSNQRLASYRLRWKRKNITRNRNRLMTLPCNTNARKIRLQTVGNFRDNPQAGVYQDIVTITVTSQ